MKISKVTKSYHVWVPSRVSLESRGMDLNPIWTESELVCVITPKYILGDEYHVEHLEKTELPKLIGYIKFRESMFLKKGRNTRSSRNIVPTKTALISPKDWSWLDKMSERWRGSRSKSVVIRPPWLASDEQGPVVPPLGSYEEIYNFIFKREG